jgi:hypothetical protein
MDVFTGVFGLIIGLFSIWFSVKFLKLYFKVKNWQITEATVVSKEVGIHKKYSTTRTKYKLNVSYKYMFNGVLYNGKNVYLAELIGGQVNHMRSDAEKRSERIKDQLKIYVDPQNPASSVIYCDGAALYYFVLAMGFFAILFGISKLV